MSEVAGTSEAGARLVSRRSVLTQAMLLSLGGCAGMWREQRASAPASMPRYNMSVRLEPARRLMSVSGVARFPASANQRQDLRLVLA